MRRAASKGRSAGSAAVTWSRSRRWRPWPSWASTSPLVTLPMKTWHMRLEKVDGSRVVLPRALLRAALATAGYLLLGVSVIWAFIDRDRQFLHDRLAGTRLVSTG